MKVGAAFVQTLASQLVQSLASILTGVLIARGLGPEGQGHYATFAAGIALGAFLASLGQFHGNVLAAADPRATPRVLLLRALLHGGVILSVLLAIAVVGGRRLLPEAAGVRQTLALLFALVLSLEAIAQMLGGINLGRHQVTGWNIASLTQRFCYFGAVGLLAFTAGLRLEIVVACWAAATFLSVLVSGFWIWRRSPPESITLVLVGIGWGGRLAQGFRAFVTVALTLLLIRADVWMLGPMLGAATVGQVSVATYLAEWLWYIPSILGNLLFAVVAADHGVRAIHQVARSARLVSTLLIVVMGVLLLAGRGLVHLLYGPSYQEAGILFMLLLPGMTALGIHLVIDAYFAGSGFPPITIWGAGSAVVAKVVLNLLLVPTYGVRGAVAMTSLVYIGLLTLKVVWFVRTTGVRPRELLWCNRSDFAYLRAKVHAIAGM
jgi:O-antigen/teichoic acid export membrane protein